MPEPETPNMPRHSPAPPEVSNSISSLNREDNFFSIETLMLMAYSPTFFFHVW
ncbi:hypothetical protein TREAZ_3228 [Leadbettera azotonutricia ZAS-9]|uniref:Uncharacterized protein n=1 Tax=Leadbettera azotonutricia (strain ATCC BAA-888 / DSM 13862 / ZAS-9) TaxID=545695 RepID=F5Y992_LEAAZ|nr:hypothetical protein TREAZ_3228 [Leadbettera azotonutricia ZAS-9]